MSIVSIFVKRFHFSGTACLAVAAIMTQSAYAQRLAYDCPTDPAYASGWEIGSNGGSGFGPWEAVILGGPSIYLSEFNPLPDGPGAFVLDPYPSTNAIAWRSLDAPLLDGSTFAFDVGTAFTSAPPLDAAVVFCDTDYGNRRLLFTTSAAYGPNWVTSLDGLSTAVDTGIPVDGTPLHVELTVTNGGTGYELAVTPQGQATQTVSGSLGGEYGDGYVGGIDHFRIANLYANNAAGVAYFDNFQTTVGGATAASDDGSQSAYADGWQNGDNGGNGFGPWEFRCGGAAWTFDDKYRINQEGPLGDPSFTLEPREGSVILARSLDQSLQPGDTFRFEIDPREGDMDE